MKKFFDNKKLGERMREARIKAGLSQSNMAEKLDISITTLSRYENASLTPKIETLANLSRILDVNMDAFFTDLIDIDYNLITDFNEHLARLLEIASQLDIETLDILVSVAEKMNK